MPKPVVLGSGPAVNLPPRDGPRADGEAVWPRAGGRQQPEPWQGAANPRWQEARPMPRRPVEVPAEAGADRLRRMPEAPVRIERPVMAERPPAFERPLPAERPAPAWTPSPREERSPEAEERIE
jgi:hypothetical protein